MFDNLSFVLFDGMFVFQVKEYRDAFHVVVEDYCYDDDALSRPLLS
jgi:hypothetical protein